MEDHLTITHDLPKPIEKWIECLLIHKKYPIMDKDGKINLLCKECEYDNDPPKDKETSESA